MTYPLQVQWNGMQFYRQFGSALLWAILAAAIAGFSGCRNSGALESKKDGTGAVTVNPTVTVKRGHFRRILRVTGNIQAVESYGVQAPRLSGQYGGNMVITKIVKNGIPVRTGDILAEFDRQNQLKNIQDKRAEYDSFVQQIRKKQSDHSSARAADETELKGAEVDVQTARVEMRKNDVVPGYQAETNKANLAEAEAKLKQLKDTFALKREAEVAELRILEIQRDRAAMAVDYAQGNIEKMTIKSPMDGLVVLAPVSKGGRISDLQAGDEVRPGQGILMVVNPTKMQVAARVNQVDISQIFVGQAAGIRLEAYPELSFSGKVEEVSAIGIPSEYVKRIRYFPIVISIQGSNSKLLPDLTAMVDLQLEATKDVLVIPREAVVIRDGKAQVEMLEAGKSKLQPIRTGSTSECEVVVESGLSEGSVVLLNPKIPTGGSKPESGKS